MSYLFTMPKEKNNGTEIGEMPKDQNRFVILKQAVRELLRVPYAILYIDQLY